MYICLNCNYRSESHSNFCPNCGQPMATVVFEQPRPQVYSAPPVQEAPAPAPRDPVPPVPQNPVPPVSPSQAQVSYESHASAVPEASAEAPCAVSGAKRILALILAIVGVALAVLGLEYTGRYEAAGRSYEIDTLLCALSFCAFCLPASLLSLLFARGNQKKGDSSALCTVSKIIAFVGLGVAGYMLYTGVMAALALL